VVSTSAEPPSEIELEFAAVIVPSFAKAAFSCGILSGRAESGCSSGVDHGLALAALDRDRRDLVLEPALFDRGERARQRLDRVGVHLLARDAALVRGLLREGAHRARGVGVLEPVEEHVVLQLGMTQADALARAEQHVRRVAHALHAAGDHDGVGACLQLVMREHHRLHAGAADLVDRGAARALGKAGARAPPGAPGPGFDVRRAARSP
jgi:hypothetical protein